MEVRSSERRGRACLARQADALLRKNIAYQKRRMRGNAGVVLSPAVLFILIALLQHTVQQFSASISDLTQCPCDDSGAPINSTFQDMCATGMPNIDPALCRVRHPQPWPPLVQLPYPARRAVRSPSSPFHDLPDPASCTNPEKSPCPVTFLYTAANRSFARGTFGQIHVLVYLFITSIHLLIIYVTICHVCVLPQG